MLWPVNHSGVQILRVTTDETDGSLTVWGAYDGGIERELVYEGMFCSQLDEGTVGLTVVSVIMITPHQLQSQYAKAAARLREDCGVNDLFLQEMWKRGSKLYLHCTFEGGLYLVLAKRLTRGEVIDHSGEIPKERKERGD